MMVATQEARDALTELRNKNAQRGSAVDIAYWTLRDAIRSGAIRPGERLVTLEFAAALNMSRTPVREALRRLEAERLVENRPGRGLMATTIMLDDLIEIFEIRGVLEGLAARRAAQRMGLAELNALANLIARMEELLVTGHLPSLWEASTQFHRLLRSGSRHARLPALVSLLHDSHGSLKLQEFTSSERAGAAVEEHRAIYEAIAAHDTERAERDAREHCMQALHAQILAHHLAEEE